MREVPSCGMMEEETLQGVLKNIERDLEAGDTVSFAFQGGEPMLAGLPFFEDFVSRVKKWNSGIRVCYALQTNAILIDSAWCRFLKENRFLVGVSLDILPEYHDAVRVDAEGQGSYQKVMNSIRLLREHQVDFNILCTLTNSIARHPKQVWNWLKQNNIDYVQFTPCLGELEQKSQSPYALTPKRFTSFYIQLFQYWYEDYRKGEYRSIKFFDDAVNLLMYGRPTSCGMNGACQPQLVVEADGSAYPCDFYCLDEYRLGNLTEQGPLELLKTETVQRFLHRPHAAPQLCKTCRYRDFCGGNCKRMQREICCSAGDSYCGYREFLEKCGRTLLEIADRHRRR